MTPVRSQRQVAQILGSGNGAPISQQLRRLAGELQTNAILRKQVTQMAEELKCRRPR